MVGVDLDGSRRIQTDPLEIIGMIKAHPTKNRMARQATLHLQMLRAQHRSATRLRHTLRRAPRVDHEAVAPSVRTATGAFILDSGLSKRNLEGEAGRADAWLGIGGHSRPRPDQGAGARPVAVRHGDGRLGRRSWCRWCPSSVVLVGLVAFSVGLLTLYLKTPGMRQEGSIRPIQQGTGLAKDVGLLGTGLTLLLDDLAERRRSG
jgi:hypothetical protein